MYEPHQMYHHRSPQPESFFHIHSARSASASAHQHPTIAFDLLPKSQTNDMSPPSRSISRRILIVTAIGIIVNAFAVVGSPLALAIVNMRPSSLLRCTRQLALSAMSSVTRRGRQRSVSTGFIVLSRAASSNVGMASHQHHDNLRIQARSMHPISMHMTSNYHHRRRDTPNSPRMSAMQMATVSHYTSDTSSANLVESLNDNAKSAYHELTKLSEKIRKLDDLYYGGANKSDDDNGSDGDEIFNQMQQADIMSDDEYDALARREAELCTLYPHLLKLLEEESGLGIRATRYGGRVGQVYNKKQQQQEAEIEKKTKQKKASSKTKTKKSTTKKRVKRKHLQNAPMLSLDNAMDDADAVSWLTRMRRLLLSSTKDDIVDDTNDESNDSSSTAQSTTIQIMAEPKIDGLSLSLRYQLVVRNECSSSDDCVYEFVWGATRGDGTQGEDVTKAVQSAWMRNTTTGAAGSSPEEESDDHFSIPKTFAIPPKAETTIDAPSLIEVRGEVVLPKKAFDDFTHNTINEAADNSTSKQPTYSNARNAASGILLRSKEPTSEEEIEQTRFLQSRLEFYAYDIVASTTSSSSMEPSAWLDVVVGENGSEMRESLTKFGFHVPIPVVMESLEISLDQEMNETDVPNLLDYHRRLMQARDESVGSSVRTRKSSAIEESDFPYQIDGVVYKLSSFTSRRVCGSSSRTPRWAIAHKFPPQCAVTRLVDIEVQVGRTGALTPVAILEPVDLGGVMVSRASLHNFHFARKMLLPKSGASGVDEEGKNDGNANSGSMMSVRKGVSVLVSRAGDVIPQVMKRVFDDGEENEVASTESSDDMISLDAPSKCPACGSPTSFDFVSSASKMTKPKKKPKKKKTDLDDESDHVVDETTQQKSTTQTSSDEEEKIDDTDSGKVLRCSGPQLLCQPRAVNALVYAYSRAGLDVKGISKSKLRHLMEENIIRFPADLFTTFGNISGEDSSKEEGKRICWHFTFVHQIKLTFSLYIFHVV